MITFWQSISLLTGTAFWALMTTVQWPWEFKDQLPAISVQRLKWVWCTLVNWQDERNEGVAGERGDTQESTGDRNSFHMACSERRKVDGEKSLQSRMERFLYAHASHAHLWIRVSHMFWYVAIIKSSNVERHYETTHKPFEVIYPFKYKLRAQKIYALRAQFVLAHQNPNSNTSNHCPTTHWRVFHESSLDFRASSKFTNGGFVKEFGSRNLTWSKTKSK